MTMEDGRRLTTVDNERQMMTQVRVSFKREAETKPIQHIKLNTEQYRQNVLIRKLGLLVIRVYISAVSVKITFFLK